MTASTTGSDPSQREGARTRALKAARTLALARRREGGAGDARVEVPYLVCACGEDRFGLPLPLVAQVLAGRPCTPVPGAHPAVAGIVALSGRIVGVVALARALGRTEPERGEAAHLVLLRGEPPVALAVDRAVGIVRSARAVAATSAETDAAPLGNGAASDYVPASGGHPDFVIIDPAQVLRRLTL